MNQVLKKKFIKIQIDETFLWDGNQFITIINHILEEKPMKMILKTMKRKCLKSYPSNSMLTVKLDEDELNQVQRD